MHAGPWEIIKIQLRSIGKIGNIKFRDSPIFRQKCCVKSTRWKLFGLRHSLFSEWKIYFIKMYYVKINTAPHPLDTLSSCCFRARKRSWNTKDEGSRRWKLLNYKQNPSICINCVLCAIFETKLLRKAHENSWSIKRQNFDMLMLNGSVFSLPVLHTLKLLVAHI